MIVWVIAGLLGMATGLRIGWALVNKQSVVSTAMIVALGSLALVAALNWPPLTLLIDTTLHWPNISIGLSQVALIGCAAGSCVMITTVASTRSPAATRRVAVFQYLVAAVIAVVTLVLFFAEGQQSEMAPQEYLRRNLGSTSTSLPWLLPLLYVFLTLTLVLWAGMRHSNRTRRGRALFVFTMGIALIVAASAFCLIRPPAAPAWLGWGRRRRCSVLPWRSWRPDRCCQPSRTGSAAAGSSSSSIRCSRNWNVVSLTWASVSARVARWCSGWPNACR